MAEPGTQEIIIRTSAELAGAEAAAAALEKNIGRAKAMGQEYGFLEQQLGRARQAIDDYKTNPPSDEPTNKLKLSFHELRAALRLFRNELGEFAHLGHFFFNPILLVIAAVVMGLRQLTEWNEHLNETMQKLNEEALAVGITRMRAFAGAAAEARQQNRELAEELKKMREQASIEDIDKDTEARKKNAEAIAKQKIALAELQYQQGSITKESRDASVNGAEAEKDAADRAAEATQAQKKIQAEAQKGINFALKLASADGFSPEQMRASADIAKSKADEAKKRTDAAAAQDALARSGKASDTDAYKALPLGTRTMYSLPTTSQKFKDQVDAFVQQQTASALKAAEADEKIATNKATEADITAKELEAAKKGVDIQIEKVREMDAAEAKRLKNEAERVKRDEDARDMKYLTDVLKGGGIAAEVADAGAARTIEMHQQGLHKGGRPGEVWDPALGQWRKARPGESETGPSKQQATDEDALRGQLGAFTPQVQTDILKALNMAREGQKTFAQQMLDALALSANNHELQAKIVQTLTQRLQSVQAQQQSWQ